MITNLKRVLVISRYFPPLSSAGASIRLVKIIKYASKQGWSFNVITQDPKHPVINEKELSTFLLDELPRDTNIIRVPDPLVNGKILQFFKLRFFRRTSIPWGIYVTWIGWKRNHLFKPDLIFVNSPPFTNVASGVVLSKLLAVPLVLDIKDDWVGSREYYNKSRLRQKIESWTERKLLQAASLAITVTMSSYESWKQRYMENGLEKKIHYIPNGEDLTEFRPLFGRTRNSENKKFRILSSASGYRQDYRDLTPFLLSLKRLIDLQPEAINRMEIEFVGEFPENYYVSWLDQNIPGLEINYSGVSDRQTLVNKLWLADLFFLVQPRENYSAISGTLYEYWAVGKAPVLLFSEEGATSELLEKNNLGKHFYFDQVNEAAEYIKLLFMNFLRNQPIWIERSGVESYDREKLVNEMVEMWEGLLGNDRVA